MSQRYKEIETRFVKKMSDLKSSGLKRIAEENRNYHDKLMKPGINLEEQSI